MDALRGLRWLQTGQAVDRLPGGSLLLLAGDPTPDECMRVTSELIDKAASACILSPLPDPIESRYRDLSLWCVSARAAVDYLRLAWSLHDLFVLHAWSAWKDWADQDLHLRVAEVSRKGPSVVVHTYVMGPGVIFAEGLWRPHASLIVTVDERGCVVGRGGTEFYLEPGSAPDER